jgi:hypothetical protein
MGFFDSFSTSFSSGLSNLGTSFGTFLPSLVEGFAGLGIAKLADVIGLTPTGAAPQSGITGAPRGTVPGPLGSAADPVQQAILSQFFAAGGQTAFERQQLGLAPLSMAQQIAQAQQVQDAQRQLALQPGGILNPVQRGGGPVPFRPTLVPPGATFSGPASQPFGVMPGSELAPIPAAGGQQVAAFPTTRNVGFATNAIFQPASLAGLGGAVIRQLPGVVGGFLGGAAIDAALTGPGGGTPMFKQTMSGARSMFFRTQNPVTGQDVWFRPAGRPVLWSGDFSACKRVKKVARKASRKR